MVTIGFTQKNTKKNQQQQKNNPPQKKKKRTHTKKNLKKKQQHLDIFIDNVLLKLKKRKCWIQQNHKKSISWL